MNAKDIAFSVIGVGMFAIIFFLVRGPADQNTSAQMSGITGQVTMSLTCPVEQFSPDPQCVPKPYETTITITKPDTTAFSKSVATDAEGNFLVMLAPGFYMLAPTGGATFPTCSSRTVEVIAGAFTPLELSCDTGIR